MGDSTGCGRTCQTQPQETKTNLPINARERSNQTEWKLQPTGRESDVRLRSSHNCFATVTPGAMPRKNSVLRANATTTCREEDFLLSLPLAPSFPPTWQIDEVSLTLTCPSIYADSLQFLINTVWKTCIIIISVYTKWSNESKIRQNKRRVRASSASSPLHLIRYSVRATRRSRDDLNPNNSGYGTMLKPRTNGTGQYEGPNWRA